MFEFIRKLQEKPESERHALAWGISAAITFLIATTWLLSFDDGTFAPVAEQAGVETLSPFKVIKEEIFNIFSSAPTVAPSNLEVPTY